MGLLAYQEWTVLCHEEVYLYEGKVIISPLCRTCCAKRMKYANQT